MLCEVFEAAAGVAYAGGDEFAEGFDLEADGVDGGRRRFVGRGDGTDGAYRTYGACWGDGRNGRDGRG